MHLRRQPGQHFGRGRGGEKPRVFAEVVALASHPWKKAVTELVLFEGESQVADAMINLLAIQHAVAR